MFGLISPVDEPPGHPGRSVGDKTKEVEGFIISPCLKTRPRTGHMEVVLYTEYEAVYYLLAETPCTLRMRPPRLVASASSTPSDHHNHHHSHCT